MEIIVGVATMKTGTGLPGDTLLAFSNATILTLDDVFVVRNTSDRNLGIVRSYEKIYRDTSADIIVYLHDDVVVREKGWDARILAEFEDPSVALCGMGGALWHGVPQLYKVPYELQNLVRGDYRSCVDDAEVHGQRFAGSCDVAVLDGFAIAVRRTFLDRIDGWSMLIKDGIDFIGYDMAISALARRYGYKIRMVGVRCYHRGGGTSVGMNVDRQAEYESSHRWFYDSFSDVMPCKVEP